MIQQKIRFIKIIIFHRNIKRLSDRLLLNLQALLKGFPQSIIKALHGFILRLIILFINSFE